MYKSLRDADDRGVETAIVYREEKLKPIERKKLLEISNLNLLHHPNIHAKCYLNERSLIITSMNMYEYSELNNREMGVLIQRGGWDSHSQLFEDTVIEIQQIINGSQVDKASRETNEEGFEMDIIKTRRQKSEDFCRVLNEVFVYKTFSVVEINGLFVEKCTNYFDKIDVTFSHRIEIELTFPEEKAQKIFNLFKPKVDEFMYPRLKFYWNYHKQPLLLYMDRECDDWNGDDRNYAQIFKEGIDAVISDLRKLNV